MIAKIYIDDDDDESVLQTELYFKFESISSFYINLDGEMNIVIDGVMFILCKDQDEIYDKLINRFIK